MHETPRPTAKARLAHEPEPSPQKQRDGEAEGISPSGQPEEGKETSSPDTADKCLTKATDLVTKE